MTLLAYSRPFWPLFLHVLGAMALFGGILAAGVLAFAGKGKATFIVLLFTVPDWIVMRGAGAWIEHDEGWSSSHSPTWLSIGMSIGDGGLILLLILIGLSFWWQRSGSARLGRIVAALSGIYLVLLAVAWLAMTGKWS